MIRILQCELYAVIINNNHWTDRILLQRGLPQGSPVSSFLFIIQNQVLATKIIQNPDIKGISIQGVEKKLNQYADDLWTPMLFEQKSLDAMMQELDQFNTISDSSINYTKTRILRIGSISGTNQKLQTEKPIIWTNDSIPILGIDVTPYLRETTQISYEKAYQKMNSVLQVWKHRSLSPVGKIVLYNTLCASLLVYKFMALGTPHPSVLAKIKKLCVNFIWSGQRSKIRYTKLIQNYYQGGLKLCDIETKYHSLKTIWAKKILTANPCSFLIKLSSFFLPFDSQKIWQCNIQQKDILKICAPSLWTDVWFSWAKINYHAPTDMLQVLDQSLWCNSFIQINRRIIVNNQLIQKGVLYVRDLFSEENNRFLTHLEFMHQWQINIDFLLYAQILAAIPVEWK